MKKYDGMFLIREISGIEEIDRGAEVVRNSFATVAEEFGLTRENCPTHPSFMQSTALQSLKDKGAKLFGLFNENNQVGFVAVEEGNEGVFYLEKLAVVPPWRHRNCGAMLVRFAVDYVVKRGGRAISIGIVGNDERLIQWYRSFGFKETVEKEFHHLPFRVLFMERKV